jgi:hypothetical protein
MAVKGVGTLGRRRMTLTSLTLIVAVALVNLTLGFGVAALVGRGPWSARARFIPPSTNDSAETPSDGSSHATMEPEAERDGQVRKTMHVASEIELIEQVLQTLQQQLQASSDPPPKEMLPQWVAVVTSQAIHLGEIHDEFQQVAKRDSLPLGIQRPTLEALAALQPKFQASVATLGQVKHTMAVRCGSVSALLAACQETRGAINAISFFPSQT